MIKKMKKQIQYKIIENYLNNINSKLSSNETKHFREHIHKFFKSKCVSTLIKIIVEVEENKVPLGQDLGCFTLELINLVPLEERVQFYKFAKRQRILVLDKKLLKTFNGFEKQVKNMRSSY
jgi:hypothetical protein